METLEVPGLGLVSVSKVAQIEICDEAGCTETFHLGAVIKAINSRRIKALTEKVLRQAAHSLVSRGQLENFGPGMYRWLA